MIINFVVQEIFDISGRGPVAVGRLEAGTLSVGMSTNVNGKSAEIASIEQFMKTLVTVTGPANVGIGLKNVNKSDLVRGMTLSFTGDAKTVSTEATAPIATQGFFANLFGRSD